MSDKKLESKIIKLDPLAKRLDDVGMTGGASKSKLSKGAKNELKKATKASLKYSKFVTKSAKRGDFGSPKASKATAKELKTASKENKLKNDKTTLVVASNFGKNKFTKETLKNRDEARKFLKRKRLDYKKEAESFRKRGMAEGGLISGKPKLARKGWK